MSFKGLQDTTKGLLDVDPTKQWEWHEAFRDNARNQYRTTYSDMIHGRETYVKSDYPSGYGGHIPNIRFDVLFRNTAVHRRQTLTRLDPSRDAHPSFQDQLSGIPTYCNKPQGSRKNPSYKVVKHDGTTGCRPPWGVVTPVREPPNHRSVPATLARARSLPSVGKASLQRSNRKDKKLAPSSSMTSLAKDPLYYETTDVPEGDTCEDDPEPLAHTVTMANSLAHKQQMVSERELLMEEMMNESGCVTPASRCGGA